MLIYTNTKSRIKPKQKSKAEREQYAAWCKKHGIDKKTTPIKQVNLPTIVSLPLNRKTDKISSLNSFVTGPVNTGQQVKHYTGDKMIGIAVMHKSNLVPIFNTDSAKDVSTMRRN